MYLKYRALPEVNHFCCKAARDRVYNQHIEALRRMRPSVDTRKPETPQIVGRNYKRYENERQRHVEITRDNKRLLEKLNEVQRQENYPAAVQQRPYTLMGQTQREEMMAIARNNRRLLTAVQKRRPVLNRNDWMMHKVDHEYQVAKHSEYRRTLPMGEIIRQERARTSQRSRSGYRVNSEAENVDNQVYDEEKGYYEE